MSFLTDRKRAVGLGAAKSGTEHHWRMTVSSYALVILTPLFVFTFGPILGAPYTEVASYFARPFPAIVAGLMIVVGMLHFKNGVQVLIEDYVHGMARHWLIIAMVCLSYAVIATAILALARLAL